MAGYANPYYDDPYLASIASNISKAFIDTNPGRTVANRAHARVYDLQADDLISKRAARNKIAGIITGANGQQIPVDQYGQIVAAGVEGGIDPKHIGGYALNYNALTNQGDSAVGRAFVAGGHTIAPNHAFSVEGEAGIAKRQNDEAARRSSISAGPGYAAVAESKRKNEAELEFKDKIRWDAPVKVGDGDAVFGNPDDPRLKGVAPGTIPAPKADKMVPSYDNAGNPIYMPAAPGLKRPPTATEVEKNIKYPPTPDASSPTGWSQRVNGEMVPVAKPATAVDKPPRLTDISPAEIAQIKSYALADLGVADVNNNYAIAPEFEELYRDKLPAAEQAGAAEYQRTNDAAKAKAAYIKALGVEPGSKWSGTTMVGRAFGGKPGFQSPAGGAAAKAATGGGAPAPAPSPSAAAPRVAPADALAQARAAIAQGKPRELVIQRLQQLGINPEGL